MAITHLFSRPVRGGLAAAVLTIVASTSLGEYKPPPGVYHTSWVGNSFGGDGGPNGSGYWVQNCAARIAVTSDGTVFCGGPWDEAGRCAGLYKDGKVNRVLLKEHDGKGRETAWGWGTANKAVAAETDFLYVANVGKKLLRFRWKPGDLDSARFVDEVDTKAEAVGLTARGDRVVVVYKDEVEVRKADDLSVVGGFKLQGARDAALDPAGSLWVLAGDAVRRYSADGKEQGAAVPGLEKPSAVALDRRDGRLIVCEDGRRQQVLFYDVTAEPKRVAVFGDEGGLYGGTPGRVTPAKLFSLRGAGTDADGNLYVAMSFGDGPSGGLFLRLLHPGRRTALGADLRGVRGLFRLRPRRGRRRRLRPNRPFRPRPVADETRGRGAAAGRDRRPPASCRRRSAQIRRQRAGAEP